MVKCRVCFGGVASFAFVMKMPVRGNDTICTESFTIRAIPSMRVTDLFILAYGPLHLGHTRFLPPLPANSWAGMPGDFSSGIGPVSDISPIPPTYACFAWEFCHGLSIFVA